MDQAKAALLQAERQLTTAQTVVPLTNATTQSGATGASVQRLNIAVLRAR